jgi:hypothetical protein
MSSTRSKYGGGGGGGGGEAAVEAIAIPEIDYKSYNPDFFKNTLFQKLPFQKIRLDCMTKLQHLVHTLIRCEIVPDMEYETKLQQRQQNKIEGRPCLMKVSDFNSLLDNFGYPCFVELKAVSEISRSYYTVYNWIVANPSQEYRGLSDLSTREVLAASLRYSMYNLLDLARRDDIDPPIMYLTEENIERIIEKLSSDNWKSKIPEVLDEIILDLLVKRYENKTLVDFPNPHPNPFSFSRIIQDKKTELKTRRGQQIRKQNIQRTKQGKQLLQQQDQDQDQG